MSRDCLDCKWAHVVNGLKYGVCNAPIPKAVTHNHVKGNIKPGMRSIFLSRTPYSNCPVWTDTPGAAP